MEKKTILLVEDDAVIMEYLAKSIKRKGYSIIEAKNGSIAWDLFLLEQPSLVVTDIYMPELDGLELLKKIMDLSPDLPVIVLSGAGTMDDVISAMRLGAWDYITKPIERPDILLYAIDKALEWVKLKKLSRQYQETLELKVLEKTRELQEELKIRKTAEKRIDQAKRDWEQTFNAIPDLIALIDSNNRIIRANKAMANAMGVSPSETVGQDFSLFLNNNGTSPDFVLNQPQFPGSHRRNIEVFDEKNNRHFELSVIPYADPDTESQVGTIHIARDITERKNAEEEKDKMHIQLLQAQKLESVGQLAAGIAHEINTPIQYVASNVDFLDQAFVDLSGVMKNVQLLLDKAEQNSLTDEIINATRQVLNDVDWPYLEEEIPASIKQSRSGLTQVSSIVGAMKEFSHPGGKEKEMADLVHIIETTIVVARNEWKYVAEVVTDFDKDLPLVMCLAKEIGQVILNLLINAAHAIGEKLGENPGGEKGTITIRTKANAGWAEISLSDTGTGIPEAIRNRVFDPFFTTKKVGRGTGQGLAIVHNVITEKHYGTINVESTTGQGTTFILRLPITGRREEVQAV